MSADGPWKITIEAPGLPAQEGSFEFTGDRDRLTGTSTVFGYAPLPISSGTVQADRLDFLVEMTEPAPMAVHFVLTVADDRLTGTATVAGFPESSVRGQRVG